MQHTGIGDSTSRGGDASVVGHDSHATGGDAGDSVIGSGGRGGDAHVQGSRSVAIGGQGGRGGIGPGMLGGDVSIDGDNAVGIGGQGGEASQLDGRGGRGGRAPASPYFESWLGSGAKRPHMKRPYGEPNDEYGSGGDAPDTAQYKARRLIVESLKESYFREKSLPLKDVWYDREIVDLAWLNHQLSLHGHRWTVEIVDSEYEFADL